MPLDQAPADTMLSLAQSNAENMAGEPIRVAITFEVPTDQEPQRSEPIEIVMTAGDKTWHIDAAAISQAAAQGRQWRL